MPYGNLLNDWNFAQLIPYQIRQLAAPLIIPARDPCEVALGHQHVKTIDHRNADAPTENEKATIHCTAAMGLTAKANPKSPKTTVTQRAMLISWAGVIWGFTNR